VGIQASGFRVGLILHTTDVEALVIGSIIKWSPNSILWEEQEQDLPVILLVFM
jgi:hypothetical protein